MVSSPDISRSWIERYTSSPAGQMIPRATTKPSRAKSVASRGRFRPVAAAQAAGAAYVGVGQRSTVWVTYSHFYISITILLV